MPTLYEVSDLIPNDVLKKLNCPQYKVRGLPTGEKRQPQEGEWILTGRDNKVYRAPSGLLANYRIVTLVKGG